MRYRYIVAVSLTITALLFSFSCRVVKKADRMRIDVFCPVQGNALAWDPHPNDDGDLEGFRFYTGTENVDLPGFSKIHDIADPLAVEILFSDLDVRLDPCGRNYIYITAYDWEVPEHESGPSNVVCYGYDCPGFPAGGAEIVSASQASGGFPHSGSPASQPVWRDSGDGFDVEISAAIVDRDEE